VRNHSKHNCIILKDGVNDPGLAFAGKVGLGPFRTWVQVLSYVHVLQVYVHRQKDLHEDAMQDLIDDF
jgi:hypothetical protein